MTKVAPTDLSPDVIARALDGDPGAFRELYRCYDPTVRWAVGQRVVRWPELVPEFEDIVQDVWCALMRNKGKRLRYHDPARGVPFRGFLGVISARLGWRIAQRKLGRATTELVDVLEGDDGAFVAKMMQADFFERLAELVTQRLDPTDRQLFEGYYVRGELLKDLGTRLGMSENTIYKRRQRLPEKLRGLAEELLGEAPLRPPPELVAVVLGLLFELAQGGLGGGA